MKEKPPDALPEEFGRYRIDRSLGEGGMGTVYLAHDSQLHRKVALKTPKFTTKSSPNLIKRFYREARSAATLQHPNICPVYDVGEIDGIHYISMAYIEGRPLSDSMKSKNFPPVANVIRVVRKVALALHEAHTQGLVHRDLKPANIMIDRRGEPIVMDFGLARQFGNDNSDEPLTTESLTANSDAAAHFEARLTQEGTVVGSPGYMSPEQLYGHPAMIGPACDVYALGVLLYELLTRQLPFPGDGTLSSIIRSVISDPTPDASAVRSQVDPKFAAICIKAMSKHVEDRYESMQAFAMALTTALKSEIDNTTDITDTSISEATSPELVRTKEQYELAKSLYQDGQFAAAASIMEKMVAGAKQNPNSYTAWAQGKLPQAHARSIDMLINDPTCDNDLWNDGPGSVAEPVNRVRTKTQSSRRRSKWKKKSGLPTWAYRIASVSSGLIILLLAAGIVKSLLTTFDFSRSAPDSQKTAATAMNSNTPPETAADHEPRTQQKNQRTPGGSGPEGRGNLSITDRLRRLDLDNDGRISKAELSGPRMPEAGPIKRLADNFENFDISPVDGFLDKPEIERVVEIFSKSAPRDGRVKPNLSP